jgi:CRISPR-associated endonuclease/helicase Cas3
MTFEQFFEVGTGHAPYDYQRRLAVGGAGRPCKSQLINAPTGLGQTAAVVLTWLWSRLFPSLNSQPSTLRSPPSAVLPHRMGSAMQDGSTIN